MGVGLLAASILERIANLWLVFSEENLELLSAEDVVSILHRLLDCRDDSPEHNSSASGSIFCRATSAWLAVLNTHFMRIEDQRVETEPNRPILVPTDRSDIRNFDTFCDGNSDDDFFSPAGEPGFSAIASVSSAFPGWIAVQFLPEFLRTALEMVQLTPWEPVAVGNSVTEARVQWRILTGYLIENTIQLQHQDELQSARGHSEGNNAEQWLHDRFREANPSVPSETIMYAVRDLFSLLTSYVSELTDYALDALDGAAVSFTSTTSTLTGFQQPMQNAVMLASQSSNDDERGEELAAAAMEAAEAAVQDSLRHVTLATNILAAVEPWCGQPASKEVLVDSSHEHNLRQIQQQQLVSLWKTMTVSFMAKSNVTTILNCNKSGDPNDVPYESDLASRVCHHQLQLADIVLSSSSLIAANSTATGGGYETTLTLTLLRALDFPDQLLYATRLWEAVEQRIVQQRDRSSMDLKRTLQAAVLTLRQQHMLMHGVAGDGNHQQQGALAIADRLLSLLLVNDDKGKQQGSNTVDAWDGFFSRQLGTMAMGRTT